MANARVALTGGTGFIGQHLLRELTRRGYQVRVLLRRPTMLPPDCTSAVIGDIARPQNMAQALADVDAVIHSAGLSVAASGRPEDDYRMLNVEATIGLARSAQRAGVRRLVFISSVRAQAGASDRRVLTEEMEPQPTDPFGRSKLAAEQSLAEVGIDWVALRLATVYGPGVTGNMARLIRLARSRLPLPFGALTARRSLLSLDNLADAVDCVLKVEAPLRRPLITADPRPLTVGEVVAAMRRGINRRPGLLPVPPALLAALLRAAGRADAYERLAEPLVADPAALLRLGWTPPVATETGLVQLMRANHQQNQ
jgi:nucleoside-diphosphate-sugar epimerase